MEIGGDFKPLLPYLNRAKELDEREPLMAYYCIDLLYLFITF